MPKTRTATLEQPDLFGAPTTVAGVYVPAPRERAPRRKVHETQRDAHAQIQKTGGGADERCRLEIAGNGQSGRTRQEIADRTGLKLQTVCGCVDRLLKAGKVFEPVVDFDAAHRPLHYKRGGAKIVVVALYHDTVDWLAYGRALHRARTSAA